MRFAAGLMMTLLAWPLAEANALLERWLNRWLDLVDRVDPARATNRREASQ